MADDRAQARPKKDHVTRRMQAALSTLLRGMDPSAGINTAAQQAGLAQTLQALAKRGWYDTYDKKLTQEGRAKAQELADQLARAQARR